MFNSWWNVKKTLVGSSVNILVNGIWYKANVLWSQGKVMSMGPTIFNCWEALAFVNFMKSYVVIDSLFITVCDVRLCNNITFFLKVRSYGFKAWTSKSDIHQPVVAIRFQTFDKYNSMIVCRGNSHRSNKWASKYKPSILTTLSDLVQSIITLQYTFGALFRCRYFTFIYRSCHDDKILEKDLHHESGYNSWE